jgi:small-conductance mechanosensitive channel
MDTATYTSLAEQVARQGPELAALDSGVASSQPGVDTLAAALDAAQQEVVNAQAALDVVLAQPVEDGKEPPDTTAQRAALSAAQDALQKSQQALATPKSELDALKAQAQAIRAAIAQCQQEMVDSGLTVDTAAVKLEQEQDAMWARIKAWREHLSDTGGYTAGGKWFHSDLKSKIQQNTLVMLGANVPAVQWKTLDGSFITMTQTLASQIFAAAVTQESTIFAVAEQHRAAMLKSADPMGYDFSGGWPAVFPG